MGHIELTIPEISQRLIDHEARLRELDEWSNSVELLLALLLQQLPGEEGIRILSRQANEFEQGPDALKSHPEVDLLDRLRSVLLAKRDLTDGAV